MILSLVDGSLKRRLPRFQGAPIWRSWVNRERLRQGFQEGAEMNPQKCEDPWLDAARLRIRTFGTFPDAFASAPKSQGNLACRTPGLIGRLAWESRMRGKGVVL
jgi:hypothetical protein